MELGRRLIQEHIDAQADGHVGEALVREDEQWLSNKHLSTRHLETLFGEVEVKRVGMVIVVKRVFFRRIARCTFRKRSTRI